MAMTTESAPFRPGIQRLWVITLLLAIVPVSLLFTGLLVHHRVGESMAAADNKLLKAAHQLRDLVGPTYHDQIVDASSVSREQFKRQVARNDELCRSLDLQYVWSVLQVDGRLVFTSATHSDVNEPASPCAQFFDIHGDPAVFRPALDPAVGPVFSSFQNEWGSGRMVLVPERDARGRVYIWGASMPWSTRAAIVRHAVLTALLVGLLLTIVVLLLAIHVARRLSQPLASLTAAADRMAAGDLQVPMPTFRERELQALSQSLDIMRQSLSQDLVKLRASEARFTQLSRQSRSFAWEVDAAGLYTYVNDAVEEVLGYQACDLVGHLHYYDLHPEAGREVFRKETMQVMARRESFRDTHNQAVAKDGHVVWLSTQGIPQLDPQGGLLGYRGIDTDVTERRETQEALTKQAGLITSLLDSVPDLIFYKDLDGVYLGCNPPFAAFVGRPRADIIGKTDYELFPAPVAEEFRANDRLMLENRQAKHNDEWVTYPDGRRVLLNTLKTPYWGPQGDLIGILGISRDITARKQVEDALHRQTGFQELLMEIASTYINLPLDQIDQAIDASLQKLGRFVGADRAYLFDYDFEQNFCRYTHEWCADGISPQIEVFKTVPLSAIPGWATIHSQGRIIHLPRVGDLPAGDGLRQVLEAQGILSLVTVPLMDGARCLGFVGFDSVRRQHTYTAAEERLLNVFAHMMVNIRQRREAEAAHARLQAELNHAQKMESIGRLAGGVAHDFNNLLMAILGYVELCRRAVEAEHPVRRDLDEIAACGQRAATLTRQLLAFARKETICPKVLSINQDITGMLKLLRQLIGEDIALAWQPVDEVWPVLMDAGQLDQILANLFVNARDAIDGQGQLVLATSNLVVKKDDPWFHKGIPAGAYVVISIQDSGCGMSPETLAHIFEPFFTTKGAGTGLGLATVHGIVQQNGGFIDVQSQLGAGSTFRIFLPRHQGAATVAESNMESAPQRNGREHILLVEDDPAVASSTQRLLEELGYRVHMANSGDHALRLLGDPAQKIDLLITDVVMPGMNGRELVNQALVFRPGLRHLFISGYTADIIARRGVLESEVEYLPKPFSISQLSDKVRRVLDVAHSGTQVA